MGRIVVFMGGSREAMAMVQRGLAGARDDLARAGVVVPSAGRRSHEANSVAHLALGGGSSKAWSDLDAELQAGGADTALLVMPGLLRLERADPRRTEIATRLAALGSDLCFVSVIGDQLTMINSFYLHQVLTWRVSSRLEPFARRQRTNLQLRYDTLLEPWYDEGPGRYAPLPLTDLDVQHPVAAILRAAGATLERGLDVSDVSRPTRLGPVGVEANRLLGAYIRAVFSSLETERQQLAATRTALLRAEKLGWCAEAFWGWTPAAAAEAVAHVDPSNQRFARAVWGTDWPLAYPLDREGNQQDFLDLDLKTVDQVHRYVMSIAEKVAEGEEP